MKIPSRRRQSRWWTALGIAVVILVGALVWRQGREDARLRVVAENTQKAQALKAQIDMRFPIGTSESLVAAFLEKEHSGYTQWPATSRTEYGVPVGDEPSEVWYCGSWTRGVRLRFESGQLVGTAIERWSADCL
jgi:hypothetical protein